MNETEQLKEETATNVETTEQIVEEPKSLDLDSELKKSSIEELLTLYRQLHDAKKKTNDNKVIVTEEDLKPKRKKRGSKN